MTSTARCSCYMAINPIRITPTFHPAHGTDMIDLHFKRYLPSVDSAYHDVRKMIRARLMATPQSEVRSRQLYRDLLQELDTVSIRQQNLGSRTRGYLYQAPWELMDRAFQFFRDEDGTYLVGLPGVFALFINPKDREIHLEW